MEIVQSCLEKIEESAFFFFVMAPQKHVALKHTRVRG